MADVRTAVDYYPFGMQMPGRSGSGGYRYGFNGKEKEVELESIYNFDARLLDVRVSRWLSVDPQARKFPDESPYNHVSNNPIIYIDPNGEAKIVVTGGADTHNKYPMNFVYASFLQLKNYAEQIKKDGSKESLSWLILDKGYDDKQKKLIKQMADKLKIKVTYVNNANEVINYVNSNTTKNSGLTDERSKDKITNMSFFSHGVASIISLG